jgi:hypothetical protein
MLNYVLNEGRGPHLPGQDAHVVDDRKDQDDVPRILTAAYTHTKIMTKHIIQLISDV